MAIGCTAPFLPRPKTGGEYSNIAGEYAGLGSPVMSPT